MEEGCGRTTRVAATAMAAAPSPREAGAAAHPPAVAVAPKRA